MSRREAEDVEARLRALGRRGGGASSEKEKEKTMRAHVRGTPGRRAEPEGAAGIPRRRRLRRAYHGSFRGAEGETKE